MNNNHLKKFAQEARRKLLEQVGAKLSFVLSTDSAELREKTEQLKQLREELGRTTKEHLIEKVAYTWFNRLMALRFMDANDYQPLAIRIITPKDGYTIPEILDEAKRGNIPEELKITRQKIYDLLDGKIPSTNPLNEAFKELLIAACNHLHTTFPFLFEKINDYTELLLPDDLTSDFSILTDMRKGMLLEDCKNVEIIGWLYQFYISEKKDEVFASKAKVKKEDIPAATQLFTPRWIVEYMVQNTLGKLWLQNRPKSRLRDHMPYFIESASLETEDYLKIQSPEEIQLADPASGSGHILVYAFDLFTKIYEEEGYNTSEIPQLIVEKNLYGFEIDERAAQLSALALMMKAREYHRRVFRKELKPNILCYQDLLIIKDEIKVVFASIKIQFSNELMHDLLLMQQATNFGSLIIPHADVTEINRISVELVQFSSNADVFQRNHLEALNNSLGQLKLLAQKFHCVIANPPYMGGGNMNPTLSEFAKQYYPDSKIDLMACFIEKGLVLLQPKGFLGMINQHSWMFLSSYERLRRKIVSNIFIDTLLHLGAKTFPEIGGEVVQNASFVLWNSKDISNGIYIRLVDFDASDKKREKLLEAIKNPHCGWSICANQRDFGNVGLSNISYWISKNGLRLFANKRLKEKYVFKQGLATGDNNRFIRLWYEVNMQTFSSSSDSYNESFKWYPYNKGGETRRWYGNQEYVVNWENNGYEIKNIYSSDGKLRSRPQNLNYYFKNSLTWSLLANKSFAVRRQEKGAIFDINGMSLFFNDNPNIIHGQLCSKVGFYLLQAINPTLAFQIGNVELFPWLEIDKNKEIIISEIVDNAVKISKQEWHSKEYGWNFERSELIVNKIIEIEESYDLYIQKWKKLFIQLHQYEEELNRTVIESYELKSELSPHMPVEDVTILTEELNRKELLKINNLFIRDPNTSKVQNYYDISLPFVSSEIFGQFISYSVGCMFGRYSLDKEGLIISNAGETLKDYFRKIAITQDECSFIPDSDNIIPILDDEWFDRDIIVQFYQFLKVTFGEKNFNKNLTFIEEQIGKDIRKYFITEFYTDHIKRYMKRPIYWMFSSPKGSFNVLIYMHRYTPDSVSNILNKYLKEFIGKLKTRREHIQQVQVSGSPAEKTKAIKETDSIDKMLVELHEYERDILYPLATERIEIDLDDGVLVNYNKFGKAVKEVNGLNDPDTKKKVKQFDWIDTSQIR